MNTQPARHRNAAQARQAARSHPQRRRLALTAPVVVVAGIVGLAATAGRSEQAATGTGGLPGC